MRVVEKLDPGTAVTLAMPAEEVVFAGEREDLEEIARQSARQRHEVGEEQGGGVGAAGARRRSGTASMFAMTIEDDGPGIPEDKAREALKRGKRLDETKPGSGLGLAIVSDLVNEYGGKLALERSSLGGLRAIVRLRRTE